jgi:hypothetical protein
VSLDSLILIATPEGNYPDPRPTKEPTEWVTCPSPCNQKAAELGLESGNWAPSRGRLTTLLNFSTESLVDLVMGDNCKQ